jgi:hypothetical protein
MLGNNWLYGILFALVGLVSLAAICHGLLLSPD